MTFTTKSGEKTEAAALLSLAERCEKATGASWDLDADIARAVGYAVPNIPTGGAVLQPWGALPRFSASIDHAMTLVPKGEQWSIEHYPGCNHPDGKSCATVRTPLDRIVGHTPALALSAAALRARSKG